ncbi:MAG: type II secretion system F family protein [Bacilli bacterium]|nr:type II secretion system F family protein [Bacilli bacterium]
MNQAKNNNKTAPKNKPHQNAKINYELFLLPISFVYTIIYDFFFGLRFIFVDLLGTLYNVVATKVDKIYRKGKASTGKGNEEQSFLMQKWNNLPFNKRKNQELERVKAYFENTLINEQRLDHPATFRFKARNPKGRMETGTIISTSKQDVNAFLVNEGYDVYEIETSKQIEFFYGSSSIFATRITSKDLQFWLTQLSTYLRAGITLVDGVRILSNQLGKNKGKKRIFDSITYELVLGSSFSDALEKLGDTFPALVINMVKAAEATGELAETLEDLADYYTEIDKTKKAMISAAAYPAVITTFALGVVVFIMVYVVPKFVGIYDSVNVKLNGLTKAIVTASNFLKSYYMVLLLILAATIIAIFFMYRSVKEFRRAAQVILMHIPVIKDIIIFNELTIFTKTFASLLKNNVFITDSIDILSKITKNEIFKEIMYNTITNIAQGNKISEAFKDHWAIPEIAYFMIVTGESTGELATMMQKVSEYYQEMHRNIVGNIKSFIEPIMITSLAIIVGVIIMAVIIPMFDLYSNIS